MKTSLRDNWVRTVNGGRCFVGADCAGYWVKRESGFLAFTPRYIGTFESSADAEKAIEKAWSKSAF